MLKFKILAFFILLQFVSCIFPFNLAKNLDKEPLTIKIQLLHQRAQDYIDLGKNEKAEILLDSIIFLKPDYQAFLKLGRINAIKPDKMYYADSCFKQAARLKRKYAPIYYERGLLYKNGPFLINDAIQMFDFAIVYDRSLKDAYYQRALLVMEYSDYRRGHGKLKELILLDPSYRDCYDLYIRVGFDFHRFAGMSKFLKKLIDDHPDNPKFQLDYVETLYRNGKNAETLQILNEFKKSFPDYSPCLQKFHGARIRLALEQDTLGTNLYWQSVNSISSIKEANKLFKDVIFLTTDQEYNFFKYGTLLQRKEFFYRFWKSRDPTLTTPFNERISEHYQRLCYTRKHNRRYPLKQFLSFFLKDLSKPMELRGRTLDLFSQAQGNKDQKEIDDMGIIFIRHGQPDDKDIENMIVEWVYKAKYGRPEIAFKFFLPSNQMSGRFMEEGWCLLPIEIPSIMFATATATSNYEPKLGRFDIPFCLYYFKGENLQQNVFLFYDLPDEALPDSTNIETYFLSKQFVLFDTNWREIFRSEKSDSFGVSQFSELNRHDKFMKDLTPGIYHAGLHLVNQQNQQEGILRLQLKVPPVSLSRLELGGIVLGDFLLNTAIPSNQKLEKSAASELVPNIQRKFHSENIISIYFEIYNLILNRESQTNFTVTIKITQIEKYQSKISKLFTKIKDIFKKGLPVQMTIEDDYSGEKPDEYIFRTILLPNYSPGIYKMKISISDHSVNSEASREISFEIIK